MLLLFLFWWLREFACAFIHFMDLCFSFSCMCVWGAVLVVCLFFFVVLLFFMCVCVRFCVRVCFFCWS